MSKSKIFDGIPIHQVMAFNSVSAPAYVGQAAALNVDGSLDDMPNMGVIIVARTKEELKRFHEYIGMATDENKFKEVAVSWTAYLRVRNQSEIAQGEHGRINPDHKDLDHDEL